MNNEKKIVTRIVAHGTCSRCGTKRILYFTPEGLNYYGERIVSTRSGNHCAYVNLLDEPIMSEIKEYCHRIFEEKGINYSEVKIGRIASDIYGVSCDNIANEIVDTIPSIKCPNCIECTMVEDKEFGEKIREIEMYSVTHESWNLLSVQERIEKIKKEIRRQGFFK